MAKDTDEETPNPQWADKFEPDRLGEDSEAVEEEAKLLPPEQSSTET